MSSSRQRPTPAPRPPVISTPNSPGANSQARTNSSSSSASGSGSALPELDPRVETNFFLDLLGQLQITPAQYYDVANLASSWTMPGGIPELLDIKESGRLATMHDLLDLVEARTVYLREQQKFPGGATTIIGHVRATLRRETIIRLSLIRFGYGIAIPPFGAGDDIRPFPASLGQVGGIPPEWYCCFPRGDIEGLVQTALMEVRDSIMVRLESMYNDSNNGNIALVREALTDVPTCIRLLSADTRQTVFSLIKTRYQIGNEAKKNTQYNQWLIAVQQEQQRALERIRYVCLYQATNERSPDHANITRSRSISILNLPSSSTAPAPAPAQPQLVSTASRRPTINGVPCYIGFNGTLDGVLDPVLVETWDLQAVEQPRQENPLIYFMKMVAEARDYARRNAAPANRDDDPEII